MSKTYSASIRSMERRSWIALSAWAVGMGFCYQGVFAVVFNLYILRMGFGSEYLGVLWSVFTITAAALGIPSGYLGAKLGTKRLVIIGMLVYALGFLGIWYSGTLSIDAARIGMVVSMIVMGAGSSAHLANAIPLFTSVTKPEDRSVGFTLLAVALSVAMLIGSFIGGWIPELLRLLLKVTTASPEPFRHTLLVPVIALVVCAITVSSVRPSLVSESKAPKEQDRSSGRMPVPMIIVIVVVAYVAATRIHAASIPRMYFNVYAERAFGFGVGAIGTTLGVAQVVMIPATLLGPALTKRFTSERAFLGAVLISVVGAAMMALLPAASAAIAGLMLGRIGFAIGNPIIDRYGQEVVKPEYRPIVMGASSLSFNLGLAVFNLAAGRLIAIDGFVTLFLLAAGSSLLSAVVFGVYFRKPRGEMRMSESE